MLVSYVRKWNTAINTQRYNNEGSDDVNERSDEKDIFTIVCFLCLLSNLFIAEDEVYPVMKSF